MTPSEASAPRLALVCGLLLALIGLLILVPQSPAARSIATILVALGVITAVWAANVGRRFVLAVAAVVGLATVASVAAAFVDARSSDTADTVILTIMVVAVPVAIVGGLRDSRTISVQAVFGAISIYLVLGVMFALLITLTVRFSSEPYFAQGTDGSLSQRVYFSYVTLATLGYGDLTPATDVGRLLAVAESIIGNLYLVTAVSLVVSRIGQTNRRAERRNEG